MINLILPILLLFYACVGPDYKRPQTATTEHFANKGEGLTSEKPELARWWTTFKDPQLDTLVDRAIASNINLKIAQSRIREARAARGVAAGDLWPQIDATGSYTRFRTSDNIVFAPGGGTSGAPGIGGTSGSLYQIGFDAAWEIDIFGGKRRALQAARRDFEALEERRRDVLITLLGEVATTYIDVRGFQARLRVANSNLESQRAAVDIATKRMNAGLTSELDFSQASALLATTQSQVPLLETQLKSSLHRLAVLLGMQPSALYEELSKNESIPSVPEQIATGIPSELLRRRPDVRAAERELAAATARIGVAKGEYFPKISLLGGFGFQSVDAGDLLTSGSRFWSVGPSLRWPIFAAGRIRANVNIQTARQEQSLLRYEQSILTALEDAENAIVTFLNEQIRRQHLSEATKLNRRTVELANERYVNGLADFLNVIDAERSLYTVEDQWIQSERNVSVALVSLYKALGGGWETDAADAESNPSN